MEGLIGVGEEIIEADGEGSAKDAALIGAAQRVEHYEIAAYCTARTLAEQLGRDEAAGLLQETLDEESAADQTLSKIAVGRVNERAASYAGPRRPGPVKTGGHDACEEREAVRSPQGQGHVEAARGPDRELGRRFEARRQELRLRRKLKQGGTTAQKKAAGRKGGKAAAKKS